MTQFKARYYQNDGSEGKWLSNEMLNYFSIGIEADIRDVLYP